jgi:hypothetical protein
LAGRRAAGLVSALATSALARRSGRDAARLCRGGHAPHRPATGGERATAIRSRGAPGHGGTQQQQCAAHRRLQYRAAPSPCATPFLSQYPLGLLAWPRVGRGEERSATTRGGLHSTGTDRPLPSFPRAPLSSEASSLPCWAWLPAGPLFLLFCPHRQQIMLVHPVVSRVHAWTDGRRRVDVDSIHRSWSLALDNDRPAGPCGYVAYSRACT